MIDYRFVSVRMSGNVHPADIRINRRQGTYEVKNVSPSSWDRIYQLLEKSNDRIEEISIDNSTIEYCFPKQRKEE